MFFNRLPIDPLCPLSAALLLTFLHLLGASTMGSSKHLKLRVLQSLLILEKNTLYCERMVCIWPIPALFYPGLYLKPQHMDRHKFKLGKFLIILKLLKNMRLVCTTSYPLIINRRSIFIAKNRTPEN
jgi:hypothetical protein